MTVHFVIARKSLKRNNFFPVEATARVFQQYCGGNQLSSLKSAQTRAHQKRTIIPCVILLNVEPSQQWRAQLYKNKYATDGTLLSFIRRGADNKQTNKPYQKNYRKRAGRRTIARPVAEFGQHSWNATVPKVAPRAIHTHLHTHTLTHTHTHCWRRARASWLLHKKKPDAVLESDEIFYSTRDELWISVRTFIEHITIKTVAVRVW